MEVGTMMEVWTNLEVGTKLEVVTRLDVGTKLEVQGKTKSCFWQFEKSLKLEVWAKL